MGYEVKFEHGMSLRTVIFDLDGTLLDVSARKAAARTRLHETAPETMLDAEIRLRGVIEEPSLLTLDRLFHGAREMLSALVQGDCFLVLYTARQDRSALLGQLADLRILDFFQEVINTGGQPKRISDLSRFLTPERSVFYVGDAHEDATVARQGGMFFFQSNLHLEREEAIERLFFQKTVRQILE